MIRPVWCAPVEHSSPRQQRPPPLHYLAPKKSTPTSKLSSFEQNPHSTMEVGSWLCSRGSICATANSPASTTVPKMPCSSCRHSLTHSTTRRHASMRTNTQGTNTRMHLLVLQHAVRPGVLAANHSGCFACHRVEGVDRHVGGDITVEVCVDRVPHALRTLTQQHVGAPVQRAVLPRSRYYPGACK